MPAPADPAACPRRPLHRTPSPAAGVRERRHGALDPAPAVRSAARPRSTVGASASARAGHMPHRGLRWRRPQVGARLPAVAAGGGSLFPGAVWTAPRRPTRRRPCRYLQVAEHRPRPRPCKTSAPPRPLRDSPFCCMHSPGSSGPRPSPEVCPPSHRWRGRVAAAPLAWRTRPSGHRLWPGPSTSRQSPPTWLQTGTRRRLNLPCPSPLQSGRCRSMNMLGKRFPTTFSGPGRSGACSCHG
mmetsp:Transcript_22461/g.62842  ORF Transcript_22461/g.62842 Transcript_22461/m.62842 type:complete len:241 (-) Transcript_22461:150-872(-)